MSDRRMIRLEAKRNPHVTEWVRKIPKKEEEPSPNLGLILSLVAIAGMIIAVAGLAKLLIKTKPEIKPEVQTQMYRVT